jgi:hypothetical protein
VLLVKELGVRKLVLGPVGLGGPKTVTRTYRSGSEVCSLVHEYSRCSGKRLTEYPWVRSGYFGVKEDDVNRRSLEVRLSRLWPAQ